MEAEEIIWVKREAQSVFCIPKCSQPTPNVCLLKSSQSPHMPSCSRTSLGNHGLIWVTWLVPLTCTFIPFCRIMAILSSWAPALLLLPQILPGAKGVQLEFHIPVICALDPRFQDVVVEILTLSYSALAFSFSEPRLISRSLFVGSECSTKAINGSLLGWRNKVQGKEWFWDSGTNLRKLTFC